MKLARLEKAKDFWFLLIISFVFFLLRLPSLFEPHWYGDEGIYQVIGMALNKGRLLYAEIWDNKPPLLYILYALFSSDQFTLRLVSLIFGLFSVIAFFFLTKLLFLNKRKITFFATALFAILFATPFLEGNIANAENFMLLPIILSAILIFRTTQVKKPQLFIAGFLLSLAFLFKVVAIFDFAAFFIFILFVTYKGREYIILQVKKVSPFLFGFFLPMFITALFFLFVGAFWDFFNAAFFQMVGYVGYGNAFFIRQGLLFIKLILLSLFLLFLFLKRGVFSVNALFILSWLAFSLFNALFAQRPYTHYLLVLLPSFVLFLGLILQTRKKANFLALLFLLIILTSNFRVYGKIPQYYQNFISLIKGDKSVSSYRAFFDSSTPRDYALSEFLKAHTKKKDEIFIWGNNAQVYALVGKLPPGRYTVAYHITASKASLIETKRKLKEQNPRFIIIMPKQGQLPYSLSNYALRFILDEISIYERIF